MSWYTIANLSQIDSPALLIYLDRVEENIRRMLAIAGGPQRLRPHMKTHKLAELIRLQMAHGINKFKCATIAEAEMVAGCEVRDVLLAYQPAGPKARRLVELAKKFPTTSFSTIADDPQTARNLSKVASAAGVTFGVFLDIDCGQHRSGIEPGKKAVELYKLLSSLPGLRPAGLHPYDGHIHDSDLAVRTKRCEEAFRGVDALRRELISAGLTVPTIIAGGSPTFPIHARRPDVECSPGTCILWDFGYQTKLPDLEFLPAALVLTRVASKPGENRLCLDLGHKAIASENPHPRVHFPDLTDAQAIGHSEEHLVISSEGAGEFSVGDALYGIPWHICPTVALYSHAFPVRNSKAGQPWRVLARDRLLSV